MITKNSTNYYFVIAGTTISVPLLNDLPDFSQLTEPTLSIVRSAFQSATEITSAPEPVIATIPVVPDWKGLQSELLAGRLYPLFSRLTTAALSSDANALSTARGDVTDSILVVQIEQALASALQLLAAVGWQLTTAELDLWNSITQELGFSDLVKV